MSGVKLLKRHNQAKILKNRQFYFGFLIWPYDVKMSIGNFVFISRTKMRSTKIKKLLQFSSMDMFTSYGHIKNPK